jgi:hypothetical protein
MQQAFRGPIVSVCRLVWCVVLVGWLALAYLLTKRLYIIFSFSVLRGM